MTIQEAKKVLEMFLHKQCDLERTKFAYSENEVWEAVKMATQSLEEVEQYRALGTVEELKEAREKQIPKKPTHKIESHPISLTTVNLETVYQCRNCHSIVKEKWNFCTLCGTRLDWEEGGTSD